MIGELERAASEVPDGACFWFVGARRHDDGGEAACGSGDGRAGGRGGAADAQRFSRSDVRLLAATAARLLAERGVSRGTAVAVDAANCAAYPIMLAAAGYGGFSLLTLNSRLTEGEKHDRLESLREGDVRVMALLDEADLAHLLDDARAELAAEGGRRRAARDAERLAASFDERVAAVVMFTSGSTGAPKAVPLTWGNLVGSARAANSALGGGAPDALWQAALPLYHVGGLQIVVRSVIARRPFVLYERFDPARMIADARAFRATHVSVVDKMLRDLLDEADRERAAAEGGALPLDPASVCDAEGEGRDACAAGVRRLPHDRAADPVAAYRCILLGGAAPNAALLARAAARGARVYASYGMTETSSAIAAALVRPDGTQPPLALLPGYEARVLSDGSDDAPGCVPDRREAGPLAVKGPGVVGGYANAPARFTDDGFFVTGDTAAIIDGGIVVQERTADMFVSGGENVYPAQIRARLLEVPGVADAHVYGAPDAAWGRRPVAFVERDHTVAGVSPQLAARIRAQLEGSLSKISRPDRVIALDEFPRSGIGKTDRRALERLDARRIDVVDVVDVRLHRFDLRFLRPFATASGTLERRSSIIVEVRDACGRTGLGECVAFETNWYLPETLADDERVIRDVLAPYVRAEVFARPEDAYAAFAALPEAAPFPLARAAVETALWDLYGKIVEMPFWQLIGGEPREGVEVMPGSESDEGTGAMSDSVPVGAVVGLGSVEDTVAQARALAEAGYRRVKLKIAPGRGDVARVRAVREALPDLVISLDANQSFAVDDPTHRIELREIDALGATWIEEPIAFSPAEADQRDPAAAEARFERLANLQRELATPICLDESFFTVDEARAALAHPELRCFAVKVAKFGGVTGALAFVREALAAGARVWMGGMYDTGISKRLHAAFETIPGIDDPGDLGTVARYFGRDVADPPHEARNGRVALNDAAHPYGIGCDVADASREMHGDVTGF